MSNKHQEVQHRHHHHKKHRVWKWAVGIILALLVVNGVVLAKFYHDAKTSVESTYKPVKHNTGRSSAVSYNDGKPFSVLLLGVDTGDLGRTEQGRSDTIIVATVTPKKTTLLSVPRDTLVTIAGHAGNNKINAAYAYDGVSGSLNTLQSYLDIPLDHYIEVNMKGLEQLSEAIGPVEVDNDLDFTQSGHHFAKGTVTINSENILAFSRMRHEDPRGDYGRQLRQRQVITALVKKIASVGSITKYQSILKAISSNMKTDISFSDMKKIYANYKDATNISQIQLQGNGQMIDGVSYEVVSSDTLQKTQAKLKEQLDVK
ncbi:LytR family transcriptional regulator [Ligilactobacillus salitolerans]|uniref:LytR family transcriptional regulator n=1 Tax=Ligilactobacillus salitolerans TaxID=1808352 RepID=A0A401ISM2_9LACO|nr:LCP family protein [Ligilactobacillus salitolerans]GBG94542.1 LytR family transcriptional regulator [Ligilactobacillus salitolerans]